MNLLDETLAVLTANGKTPGDVRWVGILAKDHDWYDAAPEPEPCSFTWEQFAAAANFEYDDSYGGRNISGTLRVVGTTWWLERGEYDGSEWWEFKEKPKRPPKGVPTAETLQTSRNY